MTSESDPARHPKQVRRRLLLLPLHRRRGEAIDRHAHRLGEQRPQPLTIRRPCVGRAMYSSVRLQVDKATASAAGCDAASRA